MKTYYLFSQYSKIGIRKVNGAKISEVMTLLNKDFVKWVMITFAVAMPIAYFAMLRWLGNFAYKTTLELVDLCPGRIAGAGNRITDGKLAKLAGSYKKSGGSVEI
jgi:hypothetical protein